MKLYNLKIASKNNTNIIYIKNINTKNSQQENGLRIFFTHNHKVSNIPDCR